MNHGGQDITESSILYVDLTAATMTRAGAPYGLIPDAASAASASVAEKLISAVVDWVLHMSSGLRE